MKLIKQILFFLILVVIAFPTFNVNFKVIRSRPLEGDYVPVTKPVLSLKTLLSGEYQQQYSTQLEDSIGLKPEFTRVYNEFDFSLFQIPHSAWVVYGKNNEFYGEHYIRAYLGDYFIGKGWIDLKAWEIKRLQDILWEKKRMVLLVMFAPNKPTYYPQYFPDRFLKRGRTGISNHDSWVQKCAEYGVNYIDYNSYFLHMKDTARYLLYPKMGMHWTYYGAYIAADTMIRYLEHLTGTRMAHPVLDSVVYSDKFKYHDDEVMRTMNLIWPRKYKKMPYPCFHFPKDTTVSKPSALVIGDSFYWHWYEEKISDNVFKKHEFWYYFDYIYPESYTKPTTTKQIDWRKEMEKYNVIMIMQVNGGAGKIGYDFLDRAYDLYDTTELNPFRKIEKQIRGDAKWMETIRKSAKTKGIPVEDEIQDNAIYLVNKDLLKLYKNY